LITQEALAQYQTQKTEVSFLLFDEIEKASDALLQLLLGHSGQGHANAGRQPAGGFVADDDLHDAVSNRNQLRSGSSHTLNCPGQAECANT
jgi:hypothetical protein